MQHLVPVLFWHLLKITPWDYQEILQLGVSTPDIRMMWTSLCLSTICSQEKLHLYVFVSAFYIEVLLLYHKVKEAPSFNFS